MIENIFFLPHGMQIIPNVQDDLPNGFHQINEEMINLLENAKNQVSNQNVVLLTPHGYNLQHKLVLYNHEVYNGSIYQLDNSSNVYGEELEKLNFHGNPDLNSMLNKNFPNFEVLVHGFSAYPLVLNWGTVVPLYYYESVFPNSKYSIICYPRTRHVNLEEISKLNNELFSLLNSLDENITLIISGDLSHVHTSEGPYGFHESSSEFDGLVQNWAETPKQEVMEKLLQLQPNALACGMSGLHLIHLFLNTGEFKLNDSFYHVPTYFGMSGFWWNNISKNNSDEKSV